MSKKNGTEVAEKPLVNVKTCSGTIRGISPLAWTKFVDSKRDDENGKAYEERVWRQKVHVQDGLVAIPSLGLRDSFATGGKDISIGKGAARAKNLIKTATVPTTAFYVTDKSVDDLRAEWRQMPSNPGRDSGTRVAKIIPMLDKWECSFSLAVMDDRLTEELLRTAIARGGLMCGVGALRVEGGGVLGRYELVELTLE